MGTGGKLTPIVTLFRWSQAGMRIGSVVEPQPRGKNHNRTHGTSKKSQLFAVAVQPQNRFPSLFTSQFQTEQCCDILNIDGEV